MLSEIFTWKDWYFEKWYSSHKKSIKFKRKPWKFSAISSTIETGKEKGWRNPFQWRPPFMSYEIIACSVTSVVTCKSGAFFHFSHSVPGWDIPWEWVVHFCDSIQHSSFRPSHMRRDSVQFLWEKKRNTQILYDHTWSGDEHLHDSMKAPEWTAEEQNMVWNDFTSLRKAHYRIVQQFCDWFKHSYTIPLKQGVGVCSRVLSNWFSRPFAMHNMTVSQHLPSRKRFRVQITFNVCWVWKLASKTPEGGLCEKHEDPSGPPIFHSLLPDWVRDRERGDEWMNQST